MHVVYDTRPVADLTDPEVVVHLVKAIRAEELKTVDQVREACGRLFPDLPPERERVCLGMLARSLTPSPDDPSGRRRPRVRG